MAFLCLILTIGILCNQIRDNKQIIVFYGGIYMIIKNFLYAYQIKNIQVIQPNKE